MTDLRTPGVLLAATLTGYVVSAWLADVNLCLLSSVALVVTYCFLALFVSWLLLRYGSGSDDVISAIDNIADWVFASVCVGL